MRIFDFLLLLNPEITPQESKVHLATWNGQDNPIDVYFAGQFDEWQRWQARKNFARRFVVSLISLPGANRWLFAGVYVSQGVQWHEEHKCYYYELVEDSKCSEMNGRMVAAFLRSGRQSYLNAEKCSDKITLSEIFAERLSIGEFPGFKAIALTKAELDLIVRQALESWRTALSNAAGVYLISDTKSGQLYVGSAYGEGGIWQRWAAYAVDGHGGNIELRKLLTTEGQERANYFRYSVLEIADVHTSKEDILRRESHWKKVLLSRSHGLNAN
jgi:flavodoxin